MGEFHYKMDALYAVIKHYLATQNFLLCTQSLHQAMATSCTLSSLNNKTNKS